jgi:hypothetical protein
MVLADARPTALRASGALPANARCWPTRPREEAIDAGLVPPFRLRPGLLSQILDLYDDLHRCRRTVDAFERLLVQELEPRADGDRGAARLLRQTRFLVAAFRAYERRRLESGRLDEQLLRETLLRSAGKVSGALVVVTVADRASDPAGSFPRTSTLTRVNGLGPWTIAPRILDAGMGDRLREMLPASKSMRWKRRAARAAIRAGVL